MTPEAVCHYLEATPFVAFRLVTAAGRKHYVPGPGYLHFSPSEKTANVYAKDGETFVTLDVSLIAEIIPDKRPAKRKKSEAGGEAPAVEPVALDDFTN